MPNVTKKQLYDRALKARDEWLEQLDGELEIIVTDTLNLALRDLVFEDLGIRKTFDKAYFEVRTANGVETPLSALVRQAAQKTALEVGERVLSGITLTAAEKNAIMAACHDRYMGELEDALFEQVAGKAQLDAAGLLAEVLAMPVEETVEIVKDAINW